MLNVPRTIAPDFRVIKIDATQYWCDTIRAQVGRIWSIFLCDVSTHVYLCEARPSLSLVFVGSTWDYPGSPATEEEETKREEQSEALAEAIMLGDSDSESATYYHVGDIELEGCERLGPPPGEWAETVAECDGDQDAAAELLEERYLEFMRCNGYVG